MHVTLANPATGETKPIKQGFSWTLFFFTPFYGIPLFIRGLHSHGAAVAAIGIAGLIFQGSALLPFVGLLLIAAMLFYGIKGNELTVDRLIDHGWYDAEFAEPSYPSVPSAIADVDSPGVAAISTDGEGGTKTCPRCAETIKDAALVCKHCGAQFFTRDSQFARRGSSLSIIKVLGIGGALLLALFVIGLAVEEGGGEVEWPSDRDQSAMAVTARELFQAFQENEQAAQMRYGAGPLAISGTIEAIELDAADEPMVSLTGDGMFGTVMLHFSSAYANETSRLRRGQAFTARCTELTEILGTPHLSGCRPIAPSSSSAEEEYVEADDIEEDYVDDAVDLIESYGGADEYGTASAPDEEAQDPQSEPSARADDNQLSDDAYAEIRDARDGAR